MRTLIVCLILILSLGSTAQAVHLTASYRDLDSFASHDVSRFNADARLSGDGSKLVYVETESGFDLSLSGWLAGREGGWQADAAAKVYLYDIATDTHKLLYVGKFSTAGVNNTTVLQSLEAGFSADINHDGSLVVVAFNSILFNDGRDTVGNSLHLLSIDTNTLVATEMSILQLAGFMPEAVPLKLSNDGSMLVFAYVPASKYSNSTFGVEYFESSEQQVLLAVPVQKNATPVRLNQAVNVGNDHTQLVGFINPQHHWFFDISDNGSRIVYQAVDGGKVIGVNSDGSNFHQIAQMPDNAGNYVAISGNGEVVVYAERDDNGNAILHRNSFEGGKAWDLLAETVIAPGRFLLNQNGSLLLFNTYVAIPGSSYGFSSASYYLQTDGEGRLFEVNQDVYDVSADFSKVLTGFYASPRLQLTRLNAAPYFDEPSLTLELPLVDVAGHVFKINLLWIGAAGDDPTKLLFQVDEVRDLGVNQEQGIPTFDANTGVLNLPHVDVYDIAFAVRLELYDASSLVLAATSISPL